MAALTTVAAFLTGEASPSANPPKLMAQNSPMRKDPSAATAPPTVASTPIRAGNTSGAQGASGPGRGKKRVAEGLPRKEAPTVATAPLAATTPPTGASISDRDGIAQTASASDLWRKRAAEMVAPAPASARQRVGGSEDIDVVDAALRTVQEALNGHRKQVAALKEDHEKQVAALKEDHEKQVAEVKKECAKQVADLKKELADVTE